MRKMSITIIGCTVTALAIVAGIIMYIRWNARRIIILNPVCIGEFMADLHPFYEVCGLKPGTELTWWNQLHSYDGYEGFCRDYKIPTVDVDFTTTSYIYSFGRRIKEIRYRNTKDSNFGRYIPIVTFDYEYEGNVVFIYTLDQRVTFIPTMFNDWDFYIIVDGKRIEWITETEETTVLYRYNTPLD